MPVPTTALPGSPAAEPITTPNGQQAYIPLFMSADASGNPIVPGTGAQAAQVQGNAASGAADIGNPVKIAGVFRAATIVATDGQRHDVQMDSRLNLQVAIGVANLFWTESTTPLGAGATLVGALRSNGGNVGIFGARFCFFIAEAYSDVAGGTLFVDKSVDGGATWRQAGSVPLAQGTSALLKQPITAASYRARVVNGANAQASTNVTSAFSLN